MAQVTKYDGVTITDAIEIGPEGQPGYSQTATLGTPGFSSVIVDDPEGSLTFETWKDWTVDETDCSFERLFTGIVYTRRIIRGPYRDGPGRQWVLEIADLQQLLAQRVISTGDGNRPAETDIARLTWLLASPFLSGIVSDNGKVNLTDNPQDFDTSNYRGQTPMELLVSIAGFIAVPGPGVTSKNAYVYWDESAGEPSLFYDTGDIPLDTATIGFSNVEADIDNATIFGPSIDAEQTENGEGRYGGVYVQWRGDPKYRQLASTIAAMGRTRDVAFSSDRIGLDATAEGIAASLLAQAADDVSSIKFSADLPSSVVNLVRPGMRMNVTFSHMPGYQTETEVYVNSTNIQQLQAGLYRVQYDVAPNPHLITPATGGDPGDFPFEPGTCDVGNVSIVQWAKASQQPVSGFVYKGATWPAPPTPGNLLLSLWLLNGQVVGSPATQAGTWTDEGYEEITAAAEDMPGIGGAGATHNYYWKIAGTSESLTPESDFGSVVVTNVQGNNYLIEISGVDSLDSLVKGQANGTTNLPVGFSITPTAGKVAFIITAMSYNTSAGGPATPVAGSTELVEEGNISDGLNPVRVIDYRIVGNTSGAYNVNSTLAGTPDWVSGTLAFICTAADNPPPPGTVVTHEVVGEGDGTTTVFFTNFPYADGSLRVWVDGVPIINGLTESDPATGEFTLDFAPQGDIGDQRAEIITAQYQGR